MPPKILIKKDKYKSARGGHSRILCLHCSVCETLFAEYQKDGPGTLRRLYMDRITSPQTLVGLQHRPLEKITPITCPSCNAIIGMPYIYKKEHRKAFRIVQSAFVKRIKK